MAEWGVFRWHDDPRYRKAEAIKIYKSEKAAERYAAKLTDAPDAPSRGFVARPLLYDNPRGRPRRARRVKRNRSRRRVRRNAPELRKVHAGLESAYLAAIARKDPKSRALAKRIKGPWVAVEKLLKRGAVPRGNPRRSSAKVAYRVKRGGRVVGRVIASSKAAAAREARGAGLTLGARLKHVRPNPPHGATLSERAEALTYKHRDDGEWYRHRFSPGVVVRVSPNRKTVTMYRPDGKPLAGNFDV